MQKSKLQFKSQNFYFLIVIFSILFLFLSFTKAEAAEISLSAKKATFQPNEKFLVDVYLNTENEEINALEGKVVFPKELLFLQEIRDGGSIINFWLERPKVGNGETVFSGIVPGGYFDKKGLVFSLVFQAKQVGQGNIALNNAKVLLNDGQGTAAKLSVINLPLVISEQKIDSQKPTGTSEEIEAVLEIKDNDPPEAFTPTIAQDPTMFNGQYFLVFATQDKGTGIDYYEVREGRGRFIRAESPYLLLSQRLDRKITVKAVDKAGNERLVTLPAAYPWPLYQKIVFSAIIIIVAGLVYFLGGFLWRKFAKRKE